METLVARITKVELDEGSGWYSIFTDSENVRKLTTKLQSKANEANALRREGAQAKISYTPRDRYDESSGRTYKNRYYESAVAMDGASGEDGIERVAAVGRKTDPGDAWRICLGAGAKLAVATMPLMPVESRDFDTQKAIAVAWARFIYFTPAPSQDSQPGGFADTPAARGAYDEGDYERPPLTDDDIPY